MGLEAMLIRCRKVFPASYQGNTEDNETGMLSGYRARGMSRVNPVNEREESNHTFRQTEKRRIRLEVYIRPETVADREAIREVNEQAFGRPTEAGIVEKVRQSPGFVPELSLVAEQGGQIVG